MDPDIEAALASLPIPNLDDIDFDALPESSTELKPLSPLLQSCIRRLEHAARQGDLVSIQELIATVGTLGHGNSIRAGRSLTLAIENSYYEVVEYLVAAGVEISFWDIQKAIEEAKASRNVRSLQLLFERWDINREFGWSDPPALAYDPPSSLLSPASVFLY
ncbi:Hypothetical predicted protein [Lecanosticta acicola]|uniref:Ankyrin repeat protein n=1 Tax=Lecanosticta acicola TaxID=111012 RepID=A0AAI8YTE6_9PEZI|nr:Hypothetical predicted protein [Lecanosticta acicola]